MDEPLLPCPFCGAAARAVDDNSYGDCQVFCAECDVSPDGGMEVMVMLPKERFEDAKRIWNRRAVLSPTARTEIDAVIFEMRAAVDEAWKDRDIDVGGLIDCSTVADFADQLDRALGSASTKETKE